MTVDPRQNAEMERIPALREVTDAEVESFWRDGVVCLRRIIPPDLLEDMVGPVEEALMGTATADLSGMGDALEAGAGAERAVDAAVTASGIPRGHFKAGTDHWLEQPEFLNFATRSPLPEIVARLLDSRNVYLYEDSVLVKEPGTQEKTAFHQDLAYFHLDGDRICTTWVPLDSVSAETGAVKFVAGSHRDRTTYRPNLFVTTMSMPGTEGEVVPDFDVVKGEARIISFDTEPGDITVHHARTIHGAGGNASSDRRRRAISVRYAGDGTVYRIVPGFPTKDRHAGMSDGDTLDIDRFPLAWP
jgi:ectoine hydroxylase-related dioxygenase (phytanoyl-CoA dioxygenase family)